MNHYDSDIEEQVYVCMYVYIHVKSQLGASKIDVVNCDHLETIFCERNSIR